MPISKRSAVRIPSYLRHKPSGQARVRINGKDHYLGPFGSEESRIRYGQLIAQHASGVVQTASKPVDPFAGSTDADAGLTINELVLAFMRHARQHYRKNGKETSEVYCLKAATRGLLDLYGFTAVDSFGPLMLKTVRQKMVEGGWVRYTVNKGVSRIRSVFRWGVENELVSHATLARLKAVSPLLAGRTEAKDNPARQPATPEQIEAVRPLVSPLVCDLIDVQRLTGARAGELISLTPSKIDRTNDIWLAYIDGHKTEHHGHTRVIPIGPKAQEIVARRMMGLKPNDRLFKIRRDSYTLAVRRACDSLGEDFTAWTPHQLRHAMGHQVREEFSLEHVQATLGHASFAMSELYAGASLRKAIEVAAMVG